VLIHTVFPRLILGNPVRVGYIAGGAIQMPTRLGAQRSSPFAAGFVVGIFKEPRLTERVSNGVAPITVFISAVGNA
jgi:hypothetical protein